MSSFSNAVLLMLANTCDFSFDCARKENKLHFFSHLFGNSVETDPSALPFRTLVVVKEETERLNDESLSARYGYDLYPPSPIVDNGEPVAAAVETFIERTGSIHVNEFHWVLSLPHSRAMGFFNHLSL
jgi:hypothetical protein